MLRAADATTSYIRGAGGDPATGYALGRRLGLIGMVAIALLAAAIVVGFERQHARDGVLAQARVPVHAIVTGCRGLASGTGITVTGYRCTAGFELDGRDYVDRVDGTQRLLPTGAVVAARTDPSHPSVLVVGAPPVPELWLWGTGLAGASLAFVLLGLWSIQRTVARTP
jgi:hypothetical protein